MNATTNLKSVRGGRRGNAGRIAAAAALILAAGLPASAQQPTKEQQEEIGRKNAQAEQQKRELQQKALAQQQAQSSGRLKAIPTEGGADGQQLDSIKPQPGLPPQPIKQAPPAGQTPGATPGSVPVQPGATGRPSAVPGAPGAGNLTRPAHTGHAGEGEEGPAPGPDEVSFAAFSDGMDLKALVEYVAETLHVMIIGNDSLTGSVVFNGPMIVKKKNLISLLNSLLENQNFTITSDPAGFYKVIPINSTIWNPTGDLPTTKIIPTPTIKPSALADAINNQLGITGGTTRLSYMDDLGVIIVTDSSRRIEALTELIQKVLDRSEGQEFIRFELRNVAAPVARQRVLDLLGVPSTPGPTQGVITPVVAQGIPGQTAALQTGVITNLSDRLSIDAAGNALIFRGYPEESQRIEDALGVIDRPNTLHYKQYYAGKAAAQIADLAERLGLGHVEMVDSSPQTQQNTNGIQQPNFRINFQQVNQQQQQQQQQQQGSSIAGGPVMIVDVARNLIIYYGTDPQQEQLKDLIGKFDTDQDEIVIINYKIKNQNAEDVADVLSGIVYGQSGSDTSNPFLPGGFGGGFNQFRNQFGNQNTNQNGRNGTNNRNSTGTTNRNTTTGNRFNNQGGNIRPFGFGGNALQGRNNPGTAGQTGPGAFNPDEVFLMADTANNQVIVKAPRGQQQEFAALIDKLDQRRPQVQIEVQIVSVTATDDFRLAFETQWFAGQFGVNTNFGLRDLTPPGGTNTTTFTSKKQISPNLAGITAALIKSNYVPIVMTAMKNNSDTRILSSPQITVDDNVQATIESTDEQPTSTTNIGTSTTSTTFNGYEQAGTTVTVTPSISEGGYMRLQYDIELSNFVGTGTADLPPPKQVRHVTSDSVTIPADTTIVVGGIKVDTKSSTVAKIPLLGDIPLIGNLFKDQNKNSATTRLYVFITPRILRDPHFRDMRLLTRGPLAEAGLATDIPPLEPIMIDVSEPKAAAGLPVHRPAEPTPGESAGTPAAMLPQKSPLDQGTSN